MNLDRLYRRLQISLVVVLTLAIAIWWFIRAPREADSSRLLPHVALIGRLEELVSQAEIGTRQLDSVRSTHERQVADEELSRLRKRLEALQADLDRFQSSWLRLGEAKQLTVRIHELCGDASRLVESRTAEPATPMTPATPAVSAPAQGATPSNPALASALPSAAASGVTADELSLTSTEEVNLILNRAAELRSLVGKLRDQSYRDLAEASLARGLLLGLSSSDWLLGILVLIFLIAICGLQHAYARAKLPTDVLERRELQWIARRNRKDALRRCHERIRELLDLSDSFCRGGET